VIVPHVTTGLRWLQRRRASELFVVTLAVSLTLVAVIGPVLAGHRAAADHLVDLLQGPSGHHWLGTDNLGRDILSRVIVATRLSLVLSLFATSVAASVGIALGAASMARRGGAVAAAIVNILAAFPSLLLALFFAVMLGASGLDAALAVGFAMAPVFARLMQTLGASVIESDYVSAARLLGLRDWRVLSRYVLPNVAEPLLVATAVAAGSALVVLSELSFLGVGVQPPAYDWGQLLQSGLSQIYTSPAYALGPAAAILVAGLTFNLVGETLAGAQAHTVPAAAPPPPVPEPDDSTSGPLADVRGLEVSFPSDNGDPLRAVADVEISIAAGERVGLVGESGSGKSLTALALAGLVPYPGAVTAARLRVAGVTLLGRPPRQALKGRVAMVFQDASRALNPALRVGRQIEEGSAHRRRRDRRQVALGALRSLKVALPQLRLRQYPHELSGGTRQRAMIAMALAADPELLIADEPTTALDVTVQRATLGALSDAISGSRSALLFISHDIAVVSGICDRLLVMYAGRIVEELDVSQLRVGAAHPYTRALLAALPDLSSDRDSDLPTIPGSPPSGATGVGCAFAPRCAFAQERCHRERPDLMTLDRGHRAACWYPRPEATTTPVAIGALTRVEGRRGGQ
jgi:peptide/nickel transport system permease protein